MKMFDGPGKGERSAANTAAEFKSSERYSLPFVWGRIHVTEEAEQAYGLAPLTTSAIEEENNKKIGELDENIKTDIWIVGPSEIPGGFHAVGDGVPVAAKGKITPEGIDVVCAFAASEKEIVDHIEELADTDSWNIDEDAPPDILSQEVHSLYADTLSGVLIPNMMPTVHAKLQEASGAMAITGAKRSLRIGLFGAAYINAANLIITGEVDKFTELTSGASLAAGGYFAYRGLKKYIQRPGTTNMLMVMAGGYTEMVANDVHRTFCPRHFNQQMQDLFESDPDDS